MRIAAKNSKLIGVLLGLAASAIADGIFDLNDVSAILVGLIPAVTVWFAPANVTEDAS